MTPSEINHMIEHPFFNYAVGFVVASLGIMIFNYILKSDDE
jgi:hypothetical protein